MDESKKDRDENPTEFVMGIVLILFSAIGLFILLHDQLAAVLSRY